MRTAAMRVILAAFAGVVLLSAACKYLFEWHYPKAKLTQLVPSGPGVSCSGSAWTESDRIYYNLSDSSDTTRSGFWVLDYGAGTRRQISRTRIHPYEISGDSLIVGMVGNRGATIMDSAGRIRWQWDIRNWPYGMHRATDGRGLYFVRPVGYPDPACLFYVSFQESAAVETILRDVGPYAVFDGDTALIYLDESFGFMRRDIRTGSSKKYLAIGERINGSARNAAVPNLLAVGLNGSGYYVYTGRNLALYDIRHGSRSVREAVPYETSSVYVCGLSPGGTRVLLTVTPFIPGDPSWPLAPELWMADLSK